MAAIDKIYGTYAEGRELADWLGKNYPKLLNYFYDLPDSSDEPFALTNFPSWADAWLYDHCPLQWVKDKITEQYNGSPHDKHTFIKYEDIKPGMLLDQRGLVVKIIDEQGFNICAIPYHDPYHGACYSTAGRYVEVLHEQGSDEYNKMIAKMRVELQEHKADIEKDIDFIVECRVS